MAPRKSARAAKSGDAALREYGRKRDFTKTREPRGKAKRGKSGALSFVIQKHDASRLHYDFRLELDGTLKSWAVPKGVPFAKGDKRLAMRVEDHPLDYAGFEGIIPQGQYGGGTVMVWDRGTWECLGGEPAADLENGKLHLALHGEKLEGEWTLVRLRGEEENQWLLLKSGESIRPISKTRDDQSIVSGRTMASIAAARDAEWQSNRKAKGEGRKAKVGPGATAPEPPALRAKPKSGGDTMQFIEPMKAKFLAAPPASEDWIYELKFDGFRVLALVESGRASLLSRNDKELGPRFPEIAEAVAALKVRSAILDGEVVALDEQGRPSFQLLQNLDAEAQRPPLAYYLFDLPQLDGEDLRRSPLDERKARLEKLLAGAGEPLRFSAELRGTPKQLLAAVKERGLEGIIGKRRGSEYETGRRSGSWIKLKCVDEQEFVIGGYTLPQGTRMHFGSLLVGYFEGGKLKFAGKVGTGFDSRSLAEMHRRLDERRVPACPFSNLPEKAGGRWSQNITPAEMKRCRWSSPDLVCQVKFAEWTRDGKLRQPVFLGLREDKKARKVVREVQGD